MIWNAAPGGMRSVVENYRGSGFLEENSVRLVASYAEGSFIYRQFLFAGAVIKTLALLCTHRVTLAHIHMAMRGSFWRKAILSEIFRAAGVPVVLHLHGSSFSKFYDGQHPVVRRFIIRQFERAATVIALSKSWAAVFKRFAPAANVTVLPNAVPLPAFSPGQRNPDILLFLGRIGPRKGFPELLKALALARRQRPGLRLIACGDGDLDEARAQASAAQVENQVDFRGWVNAGQRAEALAQCGMLVLPSFDEGLPMSVLEAMAVGVPVITTPVGGLPELITDHQDGLLVPPGNPEKLAEAIVELAASHELRARISMQARQRMEEDFDQEKMLSRLRDIYSRADRAGKED